MAQETSSTPATSNTSASATTATTTTTSTSERACDRCRERRVKCDKRQPSCLRCEKLGKPCPGYDKKRKFVDEGVGLRKKYQSSAEAPHGSEQGIFSNANGSLNGLVPIRDTGSVAGTSTSPALPQASTASTGAPTLPQAPNLLPPNAFNTFHHSPLALDQKPTIQDDAFLQTAPPSIDPATQALLLADPPLQLPLSDTDPMLDEVWKNQTFDPQFFDLQPDLYYSEAGNTCGFIPNIPEIVDEVDQSDILLNNSASATPLSTGLGSTGLFSAEDSNVWAPESQLKTSAQITHERDHEMAYLIRHFTDTLGPWMDLFDKDRHFTHLVPLKALRDALLRNAIAAVAAKQLGRTRGQKPFAGRQCQKPSAMEVLDEDVEVDWFYKAANYYDKAIAFSRQYLQAVSGEVTAGASPGMQSSLATANSDDLLVAVSIFSLYESLDNLDSGWLQHLIGLKSLLTAVCPLKPTPDQSACSLTGGCMASFWNFARADYQAAYINHQRTLLDTDDIGMWNSCGLEIQLDGSLYNSSESVKNDPSHSRALAELVAHTLLWLVLRVMNYLASEESAKAKQAQWDQLTLQLDHWYGNLPATYQPVAQIRHPLAPRTNNGTTPQLIESFFSIDVCAAALQLYHFARILLLLHRPVDSSAWGNRLKQYREVSNEAIRHAHEIIGIALGRPQLAIRVEMLLPLATAGACLEENEERKVVLELLRAIEKDTGCSTEFRCKELVQEWGWTAEPQGIA
ncbi:C6 finger domain [Lecanosticta acicola]|uniref:C6 finger domain n=1 Tax=Lecanosticta acicola TaxID=111012 RepID=A0AAI8Z5V9_9PEZI|nr:C6 finger domain [Lecanosticta acicola]